MFRPIDRRTVLKGLGTAVALPWLEAMLPATSRAALAAPAARVPNRLAFFYVPNGVNMQAWTPAEEGTNFALPPLLEPLRPYKDDLLVLSGLTCDKARPNGDGPGDHARAMSAYLTGCQPRKTAGANIKAGVSADQLIAQKIGHLTRLPSLEIGCDRGLQAGNCDSGYSCAYSANLSWRSEAMPMPKEVDPKLVFERLFSGGSKAEAGAAAARRARYNQSVLDFVLEDADRLRGKLGSADQRKLDEYLSSVREIEMRLFRAGRESSAKVEAPKGVTVPSGIPKEYAEHIRLLGDLLVLAFQGDLTRVSTFVFANEGSNRSYRFINVPEGHHDLSHHGGNKDKLEKIKKINLFHLTQFAYVVGKLKAIKEGDGTLLDHCMLVYGSGIGDGNRHNHDQLPILVAGKGGGTIKTGRHVRYPRRADTPLTNLYVSLAERMGVALERVGDSKGKLTDLAG
ncbi:MAG TPA: DUF1552 domain-containing protein [Gemmataceae bacterium]|nr:DUF1552 domain-containing protein [Gemmataceae bacterium]